MRGEEGVSKNVTSDGVRKEIPEERACWAEGAVMLKDPEGQGPGLLKQVAECVCRERARGRAV